MRTAYNSESIIQLIIISFEADHFISEVEAGGRELSTGENERVRVLGDDAQSVGWKSRCLGKTCVYQKGKNTSGDRLRLMRKIDNDVSHGFDLQMLLTVSDI